MNQKKDLLDRTAPRGEGERRQGDESKERSFEQDSSARGRGEGKRAGKYRSSCGAVLFKRSFVCL
jgi:hypothetical protein